MRRGWAACSLILCTACGGRPVLLQPGLDGRWAVVFELEDPPEARDGSAELSWDDEIGTLSGEIRMQDDDIERTYDLMGAVDVSDLGIALQLIEHGGVRRLFMEVTPPADGPPFGAWRTRWGCAEVIGDLCGETGVLTMQRR